MAALSLSTRNCIASAKSWLRFSYILFNLCALTCILVLMTAGTRLSGPGHPDLLKLNYYDLSLVSVRCSILISDPEQKPNTVQFDGPVWYSYVDGGGELESRSYFFLNSFGWSMLYDEESPGAGFIYRHPGETLRFPQIIDALNSSLFPIDSRDAFLGCGSDCPLSIPQGLRDAFAQHPITMQTAPVFAFYLIVLLLIIFMILFEWTILDDKRKKMRWRLSMATVAVVSHLIAASVITGETRRFISYLRSFYGTDIGVGRVDMNPARGKHVLLVTWLGFLATVLAGLSILARTYLGCRLERWRSAGQEIVLASDPQTHRVSDSASEALPEYTPQDSMPRGEVKEVPHVMGNAPPYEERGSPLASSSQM